MKKKVLLNLTEKFANLASFTYLITRANKDDDKVVNLQEFRKKKEIEERNKKYNLASFFELMDANLLFTENSTINIDDMHRARASAGFPPIPAGAPAWMYMVMSAIDEKNPAKRKAKFTRVSHWLSQGTKDPEEKKKAKEAYEREKAEEEKQFIMVAKRGWLKFSNIEDWADNYPLLFSNLEYLIKDLPSGAEEYLIQRHKVLKARERRQSVVPPETNVAALPIGITLYFSKPMQKIFKKWITKRDHDEWISDEKTVGNDAYVIARLKNNIDRDIPTLLFKPDEFDTDDYKPTQEEIAATIDFFLKEKPEKFLRSYLWKYDAGSEYSDSDDETDE